MGCCKACKAQAGKKAGGKWVYFAPKAKVRPHAQETPKKGVPIHGAPDIRAPASATPPAREGRGAQLPLKRRKTSVKKQRAGSLPVAPAY